MIDQSDAVKAVSRKNYERQLRRRLRVANLAAWLRAGGVQVVWLVILVAGAAIPLTEALITTGWTWVSPVLGFVIVVAAGIERIFGRTSDAAVAVDTLRRRLASERRLMMAGSDPYGDEDGKLAVYAARSEGHIADYDRQMIEYNTKMLQDRH